MNWWVDEQGRNNLAGIPEDPDNPAILQDELILELLLTVTPASEALAEAMEGLLPAERDRIQAIIDANPRVLAPPVEEQVAEQRFWGRMNSSVFFDPNRRGRR